MESHSDEFTKTELDLIKIQVLLNAKLYKGKPNPKAVMGKILGKNKEMRQKAKSLQMVIGEFCDGIVTLSEDEISAMLQQLAPDEETKHLESKKSRVKERKEQKKDLPDLKNAIMGKVVVRYAPDPSKYPHLGQGMNYLINRIYADKYDGKVVLRFDDTNPAIVKPIYYDVIKDGMMWLGATWDSEVRASSFLKEFYEITKEWLEKSLLYVCSCPGETLSSNRENGVACEHRSMEPTHHLEQFNNMIDGKYKPGEAIVRLMGDMTSDNTVMRDPVMLRVVKDQHPMLDKFYPVFPTYDFESAFMEKHLGITHVIRSGEFGTMRKELQSFLITKLGGKVPEFVSFGRFNIQGSPTKGRVIRELVDEGIVTGWDDIRLLTLVGLKKRGIHPNTARLIIQEAGLNPKNSTVAWQTLESKSKDLLEPVSKRYFFVPNPIELKVTNSPNMTFETPIHPDDSSLGIRKQEINGEFFISTDDVISIKVGDILRLKDLFNIKIIKKTKSIIHAEYHSDDVERRMKKIQWVNHEAVSGTIIVPDLLENPDKSINENSLNEVSGLFEIDILNIHEDDVIQLERFGYAKLKIDRSIKDKKISGHLIHKHF